MKRVAILAAVLLSGAAFAAEQWNAEQIAQKKAEAAAAKSAWQRAYKVCVLYGIRIMTYIDVNTHSRQIIRTVTRLTVTSCNDSTIFQGKNGK